MARRKGLVINDRQLYCCDDLLQKLKEVSGLEFLRHQHVRAAHHDGLRRVSSGEPSLASLAASSFAATQQLAKILDENVFRYLLFHEGKGLNLHVSKVTDQVLLIVTFGHATQVGKVRLYTQRAIEVLGRSSRGRKTRRCRRWTPTSRRQPARRWTTSSRTCWSAHAADQLRRLQINYKIVYYGCGLCGKKTTNLQYIHRKINPDARGKLVSIATEEERTLYFDFLLLTLGTVKGMQTRFHLYNYPVISYYNASRKLVLQGVDGVIFVADSQITRLDENVESYLNLWDNLLGQGDDLSKLGFVIQMNKRDLTDIFAEDLDELLNHTDSPVAESSAVIGEGVLEMLKVVCKQVIAKTG